MNHYQKHQFAIREMRLALMKAFPNSIRIFDRHVGLFFTVHGHPIKINKKGMCDNWAVLTCLSKKKVLPIHIEIETKTGDPRLTHSQIRWKNFCQTIGVWHFLNKNDGKLVDDIKSQLIKSSLKVYKYDFPSISTIENL